MWFWIVCVLKKHKSSHNMKLFHRNKVKSKHSKNAMLIYVCCIHVSLWYNEKFLQRKQIYNPISQQCDIKNNNFRLLSIQILQKRNLLRGYFNCFRILLTKLICYHFLFLVQSMKSKCRNIFQTPAQQLFQVFWALGTLLEDLHI